MTCWPERQGASGGIYGCAGRERCDDAYPFGHFRLATVLPGGTIVRPRLTSRGSPRDWVVNWPPRLLASGAVSYLVFYTGAGDDPPEDPIVQTSTQRQFRRLVEDYGGELVHTVYHHREPRVWIYRVTRRLAASGHRPRARAGCPAGGGPRLPRRCARVALLPRGASGAGAGRCARRLRDHASATGRRRAGVLPRGGRCGGHVGLHVRAPHLGRCCRGHRSPSGGRCAGGVYRPATRVAGATRR